MGHEGRTLVDPLIDQSFRSRRIYATSLRYTDGVTVNGHVLQGYSADLNTILMQSPMFMEER